MERQVARVNRPTSSRIEDGTPVIVYTSVEDPSSPEVIHHRIIRTDEFITMNSEASFNEQQVCWAIIVFIFEYWDGEIRSQIAKIRGVSKDDIKLDELGDLRILRQSIIHHGGVIAAAEHRKLKTIASLFNPNSKISPTHDQMHKIFVAVKQAIGRLILTYTGDLSGAPKPKKSSTSQFRMVERHRREDMRKLRRGTFLTPLRGESPNRCSNVAARLKSCQIC